ncbi:hypothetical protein KXD40_003320 [Peronospora effusa]|nr:hypothetical protein KXD40_003320 [Peronospora effusa]
MALRTIAVGEELVVDYGYKRSVAPDGSRRQTASKCTMESQQAASAAMGRVDKMGIQNSRLEKDEK